MALARACKPESDQPEGAGAIEVCQRIYKSIAAASRKRPLDDDDDDNFYSLQLANLASQTDRLVDAVGDVCRIMRTPLPLSYSRHTSRFLSI